MPASERSWEHPLGHVYVPIDEVGRLLSSSPWTFSQRDPCDTCGASISEPSLLHEAWQVQQQLWQLEQQQIQLQQKQSDLLSQLNQLQAEEIHGRPEACGCHGQHPLQVQAHRLQDGPGCTMQIAENQRKHRADHRDMKAEKQEAINKKDISALPAAFG